MLWWYGLYPEAPARATPPSEELMVLTQLITLHKWRVAAICRYVTGEEGEDDDKEKENGKEGTR